jgi:hypothetical protein
MKGWPGAGHPGLFAGLRFGLPKDISNQFTFMSSSDLTKTSQREIPPADPLRSG